MLEEIKRGISDLNLDNAFNPKFVSLDFEMGAILAFIHCFPGISIIGCWFHYAQCLFNKIKDLGLTKAYNEDETLQVLFGNCVALALCYHKNDDDSEVKDIFIEHVIHKSIETQRKYPKFKDFIDYMNDTWIEGVDESKGPLFKISWWNHWYHMETRTNNTNEAYNHRIVVKRHCLRKSHDSKKSIFSDRLEMFFF